MRLNNWVSLLVLAGAVTYIVVSARLRPGRETPEELAALRIDPDAGRQTMTETDQEASR
jgi:hypothetical protein